MFVIDYFDVLSANYHRHLVNLVLQLSFFLYVAELLLYILMSLQDEWFSEYLYFFGEVYVVAVDVNMLEYILPCQYC